MPAAETSAAHRALEDAFSGERSEDGLARRASDVLGGGGWLAAAFGAMTGALRGDSDSQPAIKVSRDRVRLGAILFENEAVSITAAVISAAAHKALPAPRTVVVPGRRSVTRYVRAAGATLRLWAASAADGDFAAASAPPCRPVGATPLADGMILDLDGRRGGWLLDAGDGDVVTLTATIHAGEAPFMREYAIDGGALLRVAALDGRASRTQMLLAYLRVAGRAGAGACFEAATRDPAFFVRWSAMREWLALDAPAALPRLRAMADADANAEVRGAAAATLAMLAERAAMEAARCRA